MKSMTYAQKAELVAKCKRVFESVKRSNQVAMAESYCDRALKAVSGKYELDIDIRKAFTDMDYRIKNKPRYRYDSKAGKWVECKARNQYNASLNDCEIRERVSLMEEWTRLEMARARQGNSLANSYAERQRMGMAAGACSPASQFGSGVNPLTGW